MKTKHLSLLLLLAASAGACKFLASQIIDFSESWSSGLPKSRGSLAGGVQSGDWVYYYESGKPRAKGRYDKDRQIGPWTFYYENGVVERSGNFDETGKRSGEWTFQYPDQTPQARGRYVADFEDGPWVYYGSNGVLEREGQFDGGKLSGPWSYYYATGKPKAQGMYARGQRIGAWSVWDEAGQRGRQDFGSRQGAEIVVETGDGGVQKRTGVLENGAPAGRWTSYHTSGQGSGKLAFCCTLTGTTASGVFEARDENEKVIASGVLEAGKPPSAAGIDAPALIAALAQPVDRAAIAKKSEELAAPSPVVESVVAKIEAEPARVPAQPQPDLTVKQRQQMQSYVAEYTDGPKAGSASVFDAYRPAGAPPRTSGQGERTEWYGKQLPFKTMKGVDGKDVDVTQYRGKKKVMLVVLRGFLGEVCAYCVAQTKALSQSRERLEQLGVEVLVIYPGAKENEASFEQAYKMTFNEGGPPYRVFYDPDLELVTQLGIAGDLASPSTIILDKDGKITFFYVGEHKADRPAAKKLLQKIEEMK